ncbi:MAG TPA: hypothetical protein VI997_01315 [Candidatus Thermoplasmatota archaeon]|nr:hypothetical protein [Candidatus Thermoplasmatota archaeon]
MPPPPWRPSPDGWNRRVPPSDSFAASGDALVGAVRVSAEGRAAVNALVARLTLTWGRRATQLESVALLLEFAEAHGVEFQEFARSRAGT